MRIENALGKDFIYGVINEITYGNFPWFYQDYMAWNPRLNEGDTEKTDPPNAILFNHGFIPKKGEIGSDYYGTFVKPILDKAEVKLEHVDRAVLLFTPNFGKAVKSGWHRDQTYKSKVLIYYFNTNNGYTEFQTGEKIDSVQDRLITFDGVEDIHRSVSQTDTKMRLVLNVNYE